MPTIPKFENLRQEDQERAQDQPELHIKTHAHTYRKSSIGILQQS